MRRLHKVLSLGMIALLSASMAVGCGAQKSGTSSSSSSSGGGEIKIGGNLELTGGTAMFGQAAQNAINLAFEQINAKGGVLGGKKLTLVAADNKSDAGESTSAVTKLVTQDKVVAVIGSMTSSVTLAAVPVVTDNKIPMISPSGTNSKVTVDPASGVRPYVFRACFIDPFQGQVGANFALKDLKAKTAAVIIDQKSDYSKGLADAFVTNFTKGNGQIIITEQYVAGSDKDFRSILTRIKAKNPDMIWVPGYYQEVGLIVKQARELGMKMPLMGGDGWDDPQLFNIGGPEALNNTYYCDHVATDDPGMATFVKDYKAKFNLEPNAMAALGYDAANLVAKAIEDAKSAEPEKIRAAIENMKGFKGVGGEITIDPKTHNPQKSAVIKENKNGKPTFLTRVAPQ